MLIMDKSKSDVLNTALERLANNSTINGASPGDVALAFLEIISDLLGGEKGFYETLRINHINVFLSSAKENSLDLIGYLLSCARRADESDDNYRYRISKQVLAVANANETSIRLAALSVPGVKEVLLKPFTHGTGSFSAYVITDDPYAEESLLEQVREKVSEVKAYGIRVEVFKPIVIPVQIKAKIIYGKNISDSEKPTIAAQATQKIRDYINSRYPGDDLIMNEIIQKVMEVHPDIYDMEFMEVRVNKRRALIVNQRSRWNERFFEDRVPKAIQVT